ncbi:hypothetical protein Tco_0400491 [Tanacetum coccineum]
MICYLSDHLGKFDEKADDGYLLGYSLVSKAFRVFNTRRQQIKETYHITFDEIPDAIKFSKPSVDNINIAKNERYHMIKYLILYCASQRIFCPQIQFQSQIPPLTHSINVLLPDPQDKLVLGHKTTVQLILSSKEEPKKVSESTIKLHGWVDDMQDEVLTKRYFKLFSLVANMPEKHLSSCWSGVKHIMYEKSTHDYGHSYLTKVGKTGRPLIKYPIRHATILYYWANEGTEGHEGLQEISTADADPDRESEDEEEADKDVTQAILILTLGGAGGNAGGVRAVEGIHPDKQEVKQPSLTGSDLDLQRVVAGVSVNSVKVWPRGTSLLGVYTGVALRGFW